MAGARRGTLPIVNTAPEFALCKVLMCSMGTDTELTLKAPSHLTEMKLFIPLTDGLETQGRHCYPSAIISCLATITFQCKPCAHKLIHPFVYVDLKRNEFRLAFLVPVNVWKCILRMFANGL